MKIFKEILMYIPFFRHKIVKQQLNSEIKEAELIDLCNRLIACKLAGFVVSLYLERKLELGDISNPQYYRRYAEKMFGKSIRHITSSIKVEKAKVRSVVDVEVVLVHLPNTQEVGQSMIVGFVIGPGRKAEYYTFEYSLNNLLMVCAWEDKSHLNFGTATDKVDFVKRVVAIACDGKKVSSREIACGFQRDYGDAKKFKWIAGCVTVIIIAVAGMFLLAPNEKQAQEQRTTALNDYVYIDWYGILHVDRTCPRLNYKGLRSERFEYDKLRSSHFSSYCPKCVSDEDYDRLEAAIKTMPGVK